jgi:hypothetical protein
MSLEMTVEEFESDGGYGTGSAWRHGLYIISPQPSPATKQLLDFAKSQAEAEAERMVQQKWRSCTSGWEDFQGLPGWLELGMTKRFLCEKVKIK